MPKGRPHALWLRQVESYLRDTGMAGMASVWAIFLNAPSQILLPNPWFTVSPMNITSCAD